MFRRYSTYLLTVLCVGAIFKVGPDIEAYSLPVIGAQSITEVVRGESPVVANQKISDVRLQDDKVCFTWTFTKVRDLPLQFITFNVIDKQGVLYDAETVDSDNGETLHASPTSAPRWAKGTTAIRHLCTSLPYVNDPLTVRGTLVYTPWPHIWKVTHFTPTIIVPMQNQKD
jgi:hypothetical protein